jgi:hypothetical protein
MNSSVYTITGHEMESFNELFKLEHYEPCLDWAS